MRTGRWTAPDPCFCRILCSLRQLWSRITCPSSDQWCLRIRYLGENQRTRHSIGFPRLSDSPIFPTLGFHQFDWHTELFISLLPREGKEESVQYCRVKSGFIHIILIFSDGERRKRTRILSSRKRFKVNLIGNIWNATYLRPFQIAPHSLHGEWNDSFQRQGHQLIMAAITYSYTTLHSLAYLAGILTSPSSQMPCPRWGGDRARSRGHLKRMEEQRLGGMWGGGTTPGLGYRWPVPLPPALPPQHILGDVLSRDLRLYMSLRSICRTQSFNNKEYFSVLGGGCKTSFCALKNSLSTL